MKKFMVVVILLIATIGYADEWTKQDTYRELAYMALLVVDYGQTLNIAKSNGKFAEMNPIFNEYPSQSSVNIAIAISAIIHPMISYLLPPKSDKWKWMNRENWQYITIGAEILAVGNNFRVGIGINF